MPANMSPPRHIRSFLVTLWMLIWCASPGHGATPPCDVLYQGEQGHFSSPSFPSSYPAGTTCALEVSAKPHKFIRLDFSGSTFDLGSNGDIKCERGDSIEIVDRMSNGSLVSRGKWCGTNRPPVIQSFGQHLQIMFKSDGAASSHPGQGFSATWLEVSDCAGVFQTNEGKLLSDGNVIPAGSGINPWCRWEITVPKDFHVELKFDSFHTNTSNCDDIKVNLDPDNITMSNLTFCPSSFPEVPLTSLSNRMTVFFRQEGDNFHDTLNTLSAFWDTVCGGILNQTSGSFSTPNYPSPYLSGLDCRWQINGIPTGHELKLFFDPDFELEPSDHNCDKDYVEIFDSPPEGGLYSRGRYCGLTVPPPVLSYYGKMVVVFHSDGDKNGKGFWATWNSGLACRETFNKNQGSISFPNIDRRYQNYEHCLWDIFVDPGYVIKLTFNGKFSFEHSADYLEISETRIDGVVVKSSVLTGTVQPAPIITSTSHVSLLFQSDISVTYTGFDVAWEAYCGETFNSASGTFSSPSYPSGYPGNLDCRWQIDLSPGQRVRLDFGSDFDLEMSEHECGYDDVEVLDSFTNASLVSRGKWCGINPPPTTTSFNSHLVVLFHSDVNKNGRGFKASWTTEPGCGGLYTQREGYLMSPNYPTRYPNNADCRWEIRPTTSSNITLTFDSMFDIEQVKGRCYYDFLEVSIESQGISRFCGTQSPPLFAAHDEPVVITFKSDSDSSGKGFFMSWTSN